LARAIELYRGALIDLCAKHDVDVSAFKTLTARYGVDVVHGIHFTVTVEDQRNRKSIDPYLGSPGRRILARP